MPNALAGETSPYLRQHADNPVDWMPWGEAAFARAREENKPIFLSIGYATCHWCHVMARESFESAAIAALLNRSFVAIKVDREERPDVDKIYMTYVQAMTGRGGWPLSVWLTPALKPFYGGTYFPPDDHGGRAGLDSILRAIAQGWANDREKLVAEAERVIAALREHYGHEPAETNTASTQTSDSSGQVSGGAPGKPAVAAGGEQTPPLLQVGAAALQKCFAHLEETFDPEHGGFGGAPKFPRASNLNLLFRIAAWQGISSAAGATAVNLATATCRGMVQGGIHDHVGGGFHRYSVDDAWFVPHFEKMLYDQAQIATNLLEARQATGDERYAWAARDVIAYVLRDLVAPEGGFHSAEDADSAIAEPAGAAGHAPSATGGHPPHAEGAFYVWRHAEITAALGADARMFEAHFGVAENGNVPEALDPHHEMAARNILVQRQPLTETARAFGLDVEAAGRRLQSSLERLREIRARRPRPLRDDKIITAWNGLMISALAKAHQVLGRGDPDRHAAEPGGEDATGTNPPANSGAQPVGSYLAAAVRAAEFVRRELYDEQRGILFRSWRGKRSAVEGFAEDYACLIQALLDLYEAGFDVRWLEWAVGLQRTMDERFWDQAAGGYFSAPAGDPTLVLRLKEDYDGAEPAASSVAALNLLRLGALFGHGGETDFHARGLRCLEAFRRQWSESPHALPQMLCALELALEEPTQVVLAGTPGSESFEALTAVLHERLRRRATILAVDGGAAQQWLAARAPWLAGMRCREGRTLAYVCDNFACHAPVETPEELREVLAR